MHHTTLKRGTSSGYYNKCLWWSTYKEPWFSWPMVSEFSGRCCGPLLAHHYRSRCWNKAVHSRERKERENGEDLALTHPSNATPINPKPLTRPCLFLPALNRAKLGIKPLTYGPLGDISVPNYSNLHSLCFGWKSKKREEVPSLPQNCHRVVRRTESLLPHPPAWDPAMTRENGKATHSGSCQMATPWSQSTSHSLHLIVDPWEVFSFFPGSWISRTSTIQINIFQR